MSSREAPTTSETAARPLPNVLALPRRRQGQDRARLAAMDDRARRAMAPRRGLTAEIAAASSVTSTASATGGGRPLPSATSASRVCASWGSGATVPTRRTRARPTTCRSASCFTRGPTPEPGSDGCRCEPVECARSRRSRRLSALAGRHDRHSPASPARARRKAWWRWLIRSCRARPQLPPARWSGRRVSMRLVSCCVVEPRSWSVGAALAVPGPPNKILQPVCALPPTASSATPSPRSPGPIVKRLRNPPPMRPPASGD